ncbi:MAG: DUF3524 domain-containing protein [Balneolales bacterium]
MNILALEPFLGGSHKAFLEGLTQHSRHNIMSVTMSDQHWKWRMSGGSVTLAEKTKAFTQPVDVILASSMTNLPAFIALTNPRFAETPVIMYMHENQLTQPLPENEERDLTFCYINYLSVLVADKVVFNSQFHLQSYIDALPDFLSRFPDYNQTESIKSVVKKSSVLHPGLDLDALDPQDEIKKPNKKPIIVWNQRWSFDKDPDKFFRIINRLDDSDCDFDLILVGDYKHDRSDIFEKARDRYSKRIIHYGYVQDVQTYSGLLRRGDIVISTAQHEFFCAAIMEAVFCGCHPLLPTGLTYPEVIPENLRTPLLHGSVFYDSEDDLFYILRNFLLGKEKLLPKKTLKGINKHLDWKQAVIRYDDLFDQVKVNNSIGA